jgi:hypothetical protein
MKWAALAIAAATLAGCAGPQRFAPPQSAPPQYQRPLPPPTDGPPYTRQKEDELDAPAVSLPRPVPGAPFWKVIPPAEYDRPYTGQLTITRGDAKTMKEVCPKTAFPITLGCAHRYTKGGEDYSCHVYIAEDDILRPTGWSYNLVLRHELGHCLGWPGNHPGMRTVEEAGPMRAALN